MRTDSGRDPFVPLRLTMPAGLAMEILPHGARIGERARYRRDGSGNYVAAQLCSHISSSRVSTPRDFARSLNLGSSGCSFSR